MKKLEEGAASQPQITTSCRVCFRKFFAAQIPHLPQFTVYEQRLFKPPNPSKSIKRAVLPREMASSPMKCCTSSY
jgi:hypothetical protein